jgi:hypothetical protein
MGMEQICFSYKFLSGKDKAMARCGEYNCRRGYVSAFRFGTTTLIDL